MKFILVLIIANINGNAITNVPGYQSMEQCRAAGDQFKEGSPLGFNTRFVCINAPQP